MSNADIVVKYGTGGASTVTPESLVAAKKSVAGTSEWKTYYVPGLTGDVSVSATGSIAVGFFGFSGAAGASGYFSGFETIPTINVQKVGDGCLPSTILTATSGFALSMEEKWDSHQRRNLKYLYPNISGFFYSGSFEWCIFIRISHTIGL